MKRQQQRRRLTREEKEALRAAHQARAREKAEKEDVVDRPDLISAVLVRWPLSPQLLRLSRVLLALIEHNTTATTTTQHCEYYDSLFADYAQVHSPLSNEVLSFAAYYRETCHAAETFVNATETDGRATYGDQWRHYYRTVLRVCFVALLAYDERVRRFVFGHHDLHAALDCRLEQETTRGVRFAAACRPDVATYLAEAGRRPYELHEACVQRWEQEYMYRHHCHTVQRPSASNTIDATT